MLIYNFGSSVEAPITWSEYLKRVVSLSKIYPASDSMWLPMIITFQRKLPYIIATWLLEFLPAFLIDVARMCVGLKPRYRKNISKQISNYIHSY